MATVEEVMNCDVSAILGEYYRSSFCIGVTDDGQLIINNDWEDNTVDHFAIIEVMRGFLAKHENPVPVYEVDGGE